MPLLSDYIKQLDQDNDENKIDSFKSAYDLVK
jgi:hypothetical protein